MAAAPASSVLLLFLFLLLRELLLASAQAPDSNGCTPGETMNVICNTCTCLPGGQWICNILPCDLDIRPQTQNVSDSKVTRCAPGTTFLRKCNRCTCDDDGQTATCTRMCPNK